MINRSTDNLSPNTPNHRRGGGRIAKAVLTGGLALSSASALAACSNPNPSNEAKSGANNQAPALPGKIEVRDGSDAKESASEAPQEVEASEDEFAEVTKALPMDANRTEYSYLPHNYTDGSAVVFFKEMAKSRQEVTGWRGAVLTQVRVPGTEGAISVRLNNPIEFVDDDGVLTLACAGGNSPSVVVTVPVGKVGPNGERILDERYFKGVHPRAVETNENSGQYFKGFISGVNEGKPSGVDVTERDAQMSKAHKSGSSPIYFESDCYLSADPNDPKLRQGLSTEDLHISPESGSEIAMAAASTEG